MLDPRFNKPSILSTPIHNQSRSILFTPDDSSTFTKFGQLEGFDISQMDYGILESFPIHQQNWQDLILYKDNGNIDKFTEFEHFKKTDGSNRYECEKSQSPQWQEARPYKGYGGKYRYNGLNGKDREYYRWDHKHKDIEIYDDKLNKLGSKDPVTGKVYRDK